jgi:hypothetical protein
LPDVATGVHRSQAQARRLTGQAIEEPPGHTVHGHQHDRVWPHERAHGGRHLRHGRPLDRDDHQVLHAQAGRVVAGVHRHAVFGAFGIDPHQATFAQRAQGLAACHGRELHLAGRQTRAQPAGEQATDGADADDGHLAKGRCVQTIREGVEHRTSVPQTADAAATRATMRA